ncbi:putative sulfate transport protein [Escherichia coli]|uniref:Sulfate transporter CysZ n=14 Tax=Gammaproteobacteria TaxID=1236 RepID=A0A376U5H7_ECOLX|nr:putative sulfate transport protein [Escherichia coli]
MKSCFLLFFRTYPNCPLRNYPVKYAEFSWDWSKELILIMVSSFTSAHAAVFTILRKAGSSSRNLGFRRFVITAAGPIFVDGGAFWWLFTQLDVWIPTLMSYVPDWLQWLSYLLCLWLSFSVLLVFGYFFSTIANWIAAPFNGLLAEQLEARLTGATPPDTGIFGIMKDVPRIMKREWQKFAWYLPRAIVLLILYLIPGIGQTVAPVLWFLFSAWMLAIQYCDYPFDNHKVPFKEMRTALRTRKITNMQFGALTSLFTMIPLLNLFIMPVAVCGATAMWVDCYRDKHAMWR